MTFSLVCPPQAFNLKTSLQRNHHLSRQLSFLGEWSPLRGEGGGWCIMQSWQLTLIDIENNSIKVVYCCLNAIKFCGWLTLIKNNIASKQIKSIINARTTRNFLLKGGEDSREGENIRGGVASHEGGGRCTLSPPPKQETLICMYVECLIPIFRRREASW